MEQTDTIYNNIYDAPNTEFKLNEDGKKHCFKCKQYGEMLMKKAKRKRTR
jgi:hypothetical protein